MDILELKNVNKTLGKKQILKDVSFTVPTGQIVGLLGKNGAGKTTIIKLINQILTNDDGKILFEGKPLTDLTKLDIAYLPERTYLNRDMKICDVLKYFSEFYSNFDTQKAKRLLKDLELDENVRISKISKGMQEKLQLILVISRNAKLYILDEPLGAVDPATRDYILDTILSNLFENSSALISTHLISDVEKILDKVVFISDGKVDLESDADKLREENGKSIDNIFRGKYNVR